MEQELKVSKSILVDVPACARSSCSLLRGAGGRSPPTTSPRSRLRRSCSSPFLGGRWYERSRDGSETQWGSVLAFEPPEASRIVYTPRGRGDDSGAVSSGSA
jgi:hypothetical protein